MILHAGKNTFVLVPSRVSHIAARLWLLCKRCRAFLSWDDTLANKMLQENAVSGRSVHEDGDLACAVDPKASTEIESARHIKYSVSVRALCEFTAKQGDLDLRFTPSPSAQAGIAGHGVVTSRRGPNYQSEVSLSGEFKNLLVRGRADGFDPAQNQIEEIKTFRGDLGTMPDNHRQLHWAQVKIYGWLLCKKLGLSKVCLALVYFDIISKKETLLSEIHDANSLKQYFENRCEHFLDWAEQELTHRAMRDQSLISLRFPFSSFRQGQRQLAEAVYKGASVGRCLMAQRQLV